MHSQPMNDNRSDDRLPNAQPESASAYWSRVFASADVSLSNEGATKAPFDPAQVTRRVRLEATRAPELLATSEARERLLLSTFGVLLYKLTGHAELTIGRPALSGEVTAYVPLLLRVDPRQRFSQLSRAVEDAAWESMRRQCEADAPETLRAVLGARRWSCRLGFHHTRSGAEPIACRVSEGAVRELELGARWEAGDLLIEAAYDAAVLTPQAVQRLTDCYVRLLNGVLSGTDPTVRELELLSPDEQRSLLERFNATDSEFEAKTFHALFEAQAARVPGTRAVVDARRSLTYDELNRRANQLAHYLVAHAVVPNSVVGVLVERSCEALVAMLGVLKAGAAYLPIEANFPAPRIAFMVKDSRCQFVVTQASLADKVPASAQAVRIESSELDRFDSCNPQPRNALSDLAYVIYTSGSTGEPKGVPIHHEGVANLHQIFREKFAIDEHDQMTEFASFSFDTSVWEIVMGILSGATLHILSDALKSSYSRLEHYLTEHRITVATFPPPYLSGIDPARTPTLREVIVAGSECPAKLLRSWNQRVSFHNAYGPTEASVCVAVFDAPAGPFDSPVVPIGRPLLNKKLYVVGPDEQLQPIGVAGELWVSGVGISRGYLGRPTLTAERFVDNPFPIDGDAGSRHRRVYKTGDLARWREDGCIEFIGRLDNQVKVRGHRVELDEVDSALTRIAGVSQAAAVVKKDRDGDNVLYGYYTSPTGLRPEELRQLLVARLPEFLIPSHLIAVAAMPLTNSDKIDRRALEKLSPDSGAGDGAEPLTRATVLDQLRAMVARAAELPVTAAPLDDSVPLELLGVNSLQFMKIVVEMEKEYGLEFDVDFLMDGRSMTLSDLARFVRECTGRA